MVNKIRRLWNTVRYLRIKQIKYQLIYRGKNPGKLSQYDGNYSVQDLCPLSFADFPESYNYYLGEHKFEFLNKSHDFNEDIDWNFQGNGKLWNYNLQYLNYILDDKIPSEKKYYLIHSIYQSLNIGNLPIEPYPASLRIINIIRLFSSEVDFDNDILHYIYAELNFLYRRPEYHLLGNHLLENGFALIMGGAFFGNDTWFNLGKDILNEELDEQILNDGAHFELSPMYHQIILFRLLELIDWYSSWNKKDVPFELFLRQKCSMMQSFLNKISFKNGDIPHFNDSADNISYTTLQLNSYCSKLDIHDVDLRLDKSGYRSWSKNNIECKVDIGQIGPEYQPGHGHSDSLSFILYYKKLPVFVEAGTSTYENNQKRQEERSTLSHNTVVLNDVNQSEVYSGFRVAERAKTTIIKDESSYLVAEHDGYYKSLGIKHQRIFSFHDDFISIVDTVGGFDSADAFFHLHPSMLIEIRNDSCLIQGVGVMNFAGAKNIVMGKYEFAVGFNKTELAQFVRVRFSEKLETTIEFLK